MSTEQTYKTSQQARNAGFMPLLRALVHTHQALMRSDTRLLAHYDLTQSQADVLFTLGNTQGLTYKDLGKKALISKGTLTGVVERMVSKGLVRVGTAPDDARARIVTLTAAGDALFQRAFPEHISRLEYAFQVLSPAQQNILSAGLRDLEAAFNVLKS